MSTTNLSNQVNKVEDDPLLGISKPIEGLKQRTADLLNKPADLMIQYTLYYRTGSNPHPQFTFFLWPSADMRIVVERAKRFCDTMSYRFVNVSPSITDINAVEQRRKESEM